MNKFNFTTLNVWMQKSYDKEIMIWNISSGTCGILLKLENVCSGLAGMLLYRNGNITIGKLKLSRKVVFSSDSRCQYLDAKIIFLTFIQSAVSTSPELSFSNLINSSQMNDIKQSVLQTCILCCRRHKVSWNTYRLTAALLEDCSAIICLSENFP